MTDTIACSEHAYMEDRLQEAVLTDSGVRDPDVHQHCVSCAECAANLEAVHETFSAVGMSVPMHSAPPQLKQEVVARIEALATQTSSAARVRPRHSWIGRVMAPALAIACTALAIQTVGDRSKIDQLNQRIDQYRSERTLIVNKGTSIATVRTHGALDAAKAQVAIDGDRGLIALRHVPAPPDGMVWQVWWVDGDSRIHSAGTISHAQSSAFLPLGEGFEKSDTGRDLEAANDSGDIGLERVFITAELGSGSDEPVGERLANTSL